MLIASNVIIRKYEILLHLIFDQVKHDFYVNNRQISQGLKRLNTRFAESINQNLLKPLKLLNERIRKRYHCKVLQYENKIR